MKRVNLEALQEKSLNTLVREAQTMAGLQHEHVLQLHCSFIANEDLWLVMPYISGGNLSQILRSQACMPPSAALGSTQNLGSARVRGDMPSRRRAFIACHVTVQGWHG